MKARLAAFRPLVLVFAGFVLVQLVTAAVLFAMKLGCSLASVEAFYRGAPDAMTRPRSLAGLLETTVPHLLAVPLTVFVIVHLVGWAGVLRRPALQLLARVTFALVLVGVASGILVRFAWPALSAVKLAAFLGLELTLVLWLVLLGIAFWPSRPLLEPETPRAAGEAAAAEAGHPLPTR
ncbi:MAG: hypothetical protein AB1730_18265 [Myxococcota bacterium]